VNEDLKEAMERKKSEMDAVRVAYLHRTPLNGSVPEYEDVKKVALEFIEANYALQRALYGKVRVKLSVAKLLR
jgi:hypothetical protein